MRPPSTPSAQPSGTTSPSFVRDASRDAAVVAFEEEMLGFFTEAADLLAVPRSVAILYGIVFASPKPLSFADIEQRLNLSKGSISQGLRVLREMGAIKEVSTAVNRTELFAPEMEMRLLIQRFLEHRLQRQLDAGRSRLTGVQRSIPNLSKPEVDVLRMRLKQLQTWHDKARALLPVARTFLKLTPG